ncbi:ABC transporter substrate-binding protein [Croceicoccus bisphenolivorans]|uniref:ABC transporter substrate-binding protein n=1 Tax=Croceicoccus bisphenolivorans TaxID=1783232 RepID=UPI0008308B0F|nr:ABC transporter substrate-binding protein [Croceicoccus bisphenolivorans]
MTGSIITRRALIGAGIAGGAGLAAWSLTRDGGAPSSSRNGSGGNIRVAAPSASTADTLDPAKGGLSTDYVRHFMLYNGLTTIDDGSLAPHPSLAESWESTDRVTWHFRLRKGVRFHDGSELTSADVVFSLRRHAVPALGSKMATIAEQFASVRADGRHGVTIELTGANADLPTILAQSHFLIVKDGADKPDGNGTGPFRLQQFSPGVRTLVVKNGEYWYPGRPALNSIELISIPDEVSRVNALLSGDVQLVMALNPRSTRRIENAPGHDLMITPSSLYTDLIMRQDTMPTGNPHFVQAIKHLVDRPLVNRSLFRNTATIANDHPIPPFHPFYNAEIPQNTLDLDKARWHLQQSGLSGVRLPVYASQAAEGSVDMASIMQEFGSRVGLNLAVNRVPADGYWSTHWMRHPLSFGNTNPRPTADLVFSLFYQSSADWNESGWKDERFDRLLVEARGEPDDLRRKDLYGEMQRIVHDKCGVMIPVFISLIDAFDKRLKGMRPVPLGGFMGYRFSEYVRWED